MNYNVYTVNGKGQVTWERGCGDNEDAARSRVKELEKRGGQAFYCSFHFPGAFY